MVSGLSGTSTRMENFLRMEFGSWVGIKLVKIIHYLFYKFFRIKIGAVDVTTNPGLSGRFLVTALPTIYQYAFILFYCTFDIRLIF